MSITRKIVQIGTCLGIAIPLDVFRLLDIDPKKSRFYFRQDDSGRVFISVLLPNVKKIDERKFSNKGSKSFYVILPPILLDLWGLKFGDETEIKLNKENLMELEIIPARLK